MPDVTGGALPSVAARHRLSRGAEPRHDRRQPDPCRSRRPTGSRFSRRSARRSTLRGPEGVRTIPVEDYMLGRARSALRPGELLVSVKAPARPLGALGLSQDLPQDRRIRPCDRRVRRRSRVRRLPRGHRRDRAAPIVIADAALFGGRIAATTSSSFDARAADDLGRGRHERSARSPDACRRARGGPRGCGA